MLPSPRDTATSLSPLNVDFGSRALLRRHTVTFQDPTLVPAFVLGNRDRVRALRAKLDVNSASSFPNLLVLNRAMIDQAPRTDGGILQLSGGESLVMEFLSADDLVSGSMVCRSWRTLCRMDHLWTKFLYTPVERYPLRQLLHLEDDRMYPAIQVYMHFRSSGLVQPRSSCVHIGTNVALKQSRGTVPFRQWLDAQPSPLPSSTLRAVCRQLLVAATAVVSTESREVSEFPFDAIYMHYDEACGAVASSHEGRVPLLQVATHAGDLYRSDHDWHHRHRRHRNDDDHFFTGPALNDGDGQLPSSPRHHHQPSIPRLVLSFLHSALDISVGREVAHENLVRRCLTGHASMDPALKSMIEYGMYLLQCPRHPDLFSTLLVHPFFHDDSTTTLWPSVDLTLHTMTPATYLANVVTWFHTKPALAQRFLFPLTFTPSTWVCHDVVHMTEVDTSALLRYRYTSLRAPTTADSNWMAVAAVHQASTLHSLDLSLVQLPTSTVLNALGPLRNLTDLILPQTWMPNNHMEPLVAAFQSHLSKLERVDKAFLTALQTLDDSYSQQLRIVDFAYPPDKAVVIKAA
ncbi:hypothetical protein DYB34_005702 [Aphanomyces astaci]|uniref:F-box domain-containing protein n=1 Tax=Aphanomyces astaci TaxID=112090 RepID=A0A3R6VZY3_APHAT|nr:hypothetical protein DYB34_005702 [Aphanomyces astaci]